MLGHLAVTWLYLVMIVFDTFIATLNPSSLLYTLLYCPICFFILKEIASPTAFPTYSPKSFWGNEALSWRNFWKGHQWPQYKISPPLFSSWPLKFLPHYLGLSPDSTFCLPSHFPPHTIPRTPYFLCSCSITQLQPGLNLWGRLCSPAPPLHATDCLSYRNIPPQPEGSSEYDSLSLVSPNQIPQTKSLQQQIVPSYSIGSRLGTAPWALREDLSDYWPSVFSCGLIVSACLHLHMDCVSWMSLDCVQFLSFKNICPFDQGPTQRSHLNFFHKDFIFHVTFTSYKWT